jgi:heptosyltransferase-2
MTARRKNILIVKYGALGDVVRTSYILKGLCNKYRNARIFWLTAERSLDVLRFNPMIFALATPGPQLAALQNTLFDLVISLDDEIEILKTIDQLNYQKLVGACLVGGSPTYTPEAAEWFDMGLISRLGKQRADQLKRENHREHNEILASMLEIDIDEPAFYNSALIEARMATRFDRRFFNIGLNSGAGGRWQSKELPIGETVELIEKLLELEILGNRSRVHLLGGEDELERHCEIMARVASDRLHDTGNDNTLLEFAALVRQCDYLITSDSLALHLAISQQVHNLSFYAPTSAAEIGTFDTGVKVLSSAADYCSYRPDADNSSITADRILAAMHEHLRF